MRKVCALIHLAVIGLLSVCLPVSAAQVAGELTKWHPITVDFSGPLASETDDDVNPFLDYRLTVIFLSPSGVETRVPGFFDGDGMGFGVGNIWRARFSADETGLWHYEAELRKGNELAVSLDVHAGELVPLDNASGSFDIAPVASDDPPFLRHGRLEYVGDHYLKFRDGPYWIKGGTDSPENILAFSGIDGTEDHGGIFSDFLHDFSAHRQDWNASDPFFMHSQTGADSQGLIGALNYLGDRGVNSIYFLPMNLGGDGQDTYPFVSATNDRYSKTHYDISKLYQWNTVLNHAQEQGVALNVVLSETEPENETWLDNGQLGVERRLFFRELVARFGYLLAVKWNLGEENDYPRVELDKHADYIQSIDWSGKPIAVHTHINQFYRYGEIVGDSRYSATSIQYDPEFAGEFVEQWRSNSALTGHRWVVDMDENTNGMRPEDTAERRKEILYDVLFSGGNIEWYFGDNPLPVGGDVNAGDFRLREALWDQMRFARELMESTMPFWLMQPADELIVDESGSYGGAEVFMLSGHTYAIYLPASNGLEKLDLRGQEGLFSQRWFDPRTADFFQGQSNIRGNQWLSIGDAPHSSGEDWVVLITENTEANPDDIVESGSETQPLDGPRFIDIPKPQLRAGDNLSVRLSAVDSNGLNPSVTTGDLPAGMRIHSDGLGSLSLEWLVPSSAARLTEIDLVAIRANDSSVRTVQKLRLIRVDTSAGDTVAEGESSQLQTDNVQEPVAVAPVFQPMESLQISVGQSVAQRVVATDANGIPPSLIVLNAPSGSEFLDNGDGSRMFYWTPTEDDVGIRTLHFEAKDSDFSELADYTSIVISITRP